MKNGDPRSATWLKRRMRTYPRDSVSTHSVLLLVSEIDVPLTDILTWTDEQCALAEDWAGAVHFSASDNNNRVPAMPEFLGRYRRAALPSNVSKTSLNPAEAWPFPQPLETP